MNQTREEVFLALRELSEFYPEWRIGQMLTNVATWSRGTTASAIWDIDDQELVDTIRAHIAKRSLRG